jgi:GGDEF domain-containing protein
VSSRPIQTASGPLQLTMSFGLLLSDSRGARPVEELLHQVDSALYCAKAGGRNCVQLAKPDMSRGDVAVAVRETADKGR